MMEILLLFGGWAVTDMQAHAPETIKQLLELIREVRAPNEGRGFTAEWMTALASLIGSIAWPVVALVFLGFFHKPIRNLMSGVTDFEILGAKFRRRLEQELNDAAREAPLGQPEPPTAAEQDRAKNVERLLHDAPPAVVRQQAEVLAVEYERIRSSMPSGEERTRSMGIVVAKMRSLGRAVYPLRYELMQSPSPGERLMAIVAMQVVPDYEQAIWLAERISREQPFVGYHALLALVQAVRLPQARQYKRELTAAAQVADAARSSIGSDPGRKKLLTQFLDEVAELDVVLP